MNWTIVYALKGTLKEKIFFSTPDNWKETKGSANK